MEKPKLLLFLDRHPFIRNNMQKVLTVCMFLDLLAGVFEQYQMTGPLAAISAWTTVFFGLCAVLYWCMLREYQQTQDAWHWASDGYERQLRFFVVAAAAMASSLKRRMHKRERLPSRANQEVLTQPSPIILISWLKVHQYQDSRSGSPPNVLWSSVLSIRFVRFLSSTASSALRRERWKPALLC